MRKLAPACAADGTLSSRSSDNHTEAPFDPASPLLGKHPKEVRAQAEASPSSEIAELQPLGTIEEAPRCRIAHCGQRAGRCRRPSGMTTRDSHREVRVEQHDFQTREEFSGHNVHFLNCAQKYKNLTTKH